LAPEKSKNIKNWLTDQNIYSDEHFQEYLRSKLQESKLQEKFKEDTKKSEEDSEK